nr:FAD-dependent oxidoreductase [Ruminococcus sp.]
MIRVSNLKLPVDYSDSQMRKAVAKELRTDNNSIEKISLFKRSIDARKKDNVHFTITVDVILNADENKVLNRSKSKNAVIAKPYKYAITKHSPLNTRPVIIGFGPAGMFAGLTLAQAGEKPIIIEQGMDCDNRVKDVESFIKTGRLNTRSNIQFGEGGAGTFSDGKLNTGTKDVRARHILNEFFAHGAPEEILYNAKPHIGTDKLREVVKEIRKDIINMGGEVYFNTKLIGLIMSNGAVKGIETGSNGNKSTIETDSVILAIGHSSRDTFKMLNNSNIFMEQKAFSVGARIEHLRENIDRSQYGIFAGNPQLGAAYYKLNVHTKNGRGAYTFCMCPGGTVVPAASEENMLCVNGMSEFNRDAENSNSALLVSVNPKDFGSEHPLAGIEYQRGIERKAYEAGGGEYIAPVQRVEDFLNKRASTSFGAVKPSYSRGTSFNDINNIYPECVTESMREAIIAMDN